MLKKSFPVLVFAVIASFRLAAQNGCNLINSATFSVPSQTVNQGSVLRLLGSSCPIEINQWNYIVWSKDASNGGKIYYNGQLVYTGDFQDVNYWWGRLDIGAEFFVNWGFWFKGLIDEVRISNKVRTASEILESYNSNLPLPLDASTIGLWRFDEGAGSITNGLVGPQGNISNGAWSQGKFGSCVNYNGVSTRVSFPFSTPTSNMSVEFWIKPFEIPLLGSRPLSLHGGNTSSFVMETVNTNYTWSNGATGSSVTVNPSQLPYLWVSNGSCSDTIFFNSQSAIYHDTVHVAVTDTLIINTTVSGVSAPGNINVIKVYPNPASTQVTINYGNYSIMNGYKILITNSLGQQVFQSVINHPFDILNITNWGGNGVYPLYIIDPQGNIVDVRKIILQ
jgi:hypothetical protein